MIYNNKGHVTVNFTVGFGNNIFQYVYAKLLSKAQCATFQHPSLSPLGIESQFSSGHDNNLPTKIINDKNASLDLLLNRREPCNYIVNGYFENYKFYKPFLKEIRTWFPAVEKKNNKDLILHMRLQNRLVQANHHKNFITSEGYKRAFSNFEFDKLHIVTDAEKWDHYNIEDVKKIRDAVRSGPNPFSELVPPSVSIDYINELVDGFSEYNPIIHCNGADMIKGSGALRSDFMRDFDLIRSFDKIILFNSTFSWWAATLSEANQVGTYRPWKPNKGKRNKNLGLTNFPGWFSWE